MCEGEFLSSSVIAKLEELTPGACTGVCIPRFDSYAGRPEVSANIDGVGEGHSVGCGARTKTSESQFSRGNGRSAFENAGVAAGRVSRISIE